MQVEIRVDFDLVRIPKEDGGIGADDYGRSIEQVSGLERLTGKYRNQPGLPGFENNFTLINNGSRWIRTSTWVKRYHGPGYSPHCTQAQINNLNLTGWVFIMAIAIGLMMHLVKDRDWILLKMEGMFNS
jgi:hypothetical protein